MKKTTKSGFEGEIRGVNEKYKQEGNDVHEAKQL